MSDRQRMIRGLEEDLSAARAEYKRLLDEHDLKKAEYYDSLGLLDDLYIDIVTLESRLAREMQDDES